MDLFDLIYTVKKSQLDLPPIFEITENLWWKPQKIITVQDFTVSAQKTTSVEKVNCYAKYSYSLDKDEWIYNETHVLVCFEMLESFSDKLINSKLLLFYS